MRTRARWTLVASVVALLACSEVTVEGGGPLTFSLTADQTTGSVGTELTFRYQAGGTALDGIVVEYGDGTADSVAAFGAQTASGFVTHAFAAAGTYVVEGRVEQFGQRLEDEVEVQITAP